MDKWIIFVCGALLILCVGIFGIGDDAAVTETASITETQETSVSEEQNALSFVTEVAEMIGWRIDTTGR